MWNSVLEWLPPTLRVILAALPASLSERAEEIRIREGRPLEVVYSGGFAFIAANGKSVAEPEKAYHPDHNDCLKLLDRISNHSLYTMEEELRRGYITVHGGHRIGLAGRAVLEKGQVRSLKDIGGFNIRIAREVRGVALPLLPYLWESGGHGLRHTLIISPPGRGKTTLLRDLARLLGSGGGGSASSTESKRCYKVGVVDERSEIAGSVQGKPSFDVGPRTDVLDACPKAEGMMMMIRSLSPQVLVVDEIGRAEDTAAVQEALHSGISVVATAHGRDLADVRSRPTLAPLFENKVFSRIVTLRGSGPAGSILSICDGEGRTVKPSLAPMSAEGANR